MGERVTQPGKAEISRASRLKKAVDSRGACTRRAHQAGNEAQKEKWKFGRRFHFVCATAFRRQDCRILRRLSRYFRSEARRGFEFSALSRRRKKQQRP